MADPRAPYIVRPAPPVRPAHFTKPGLHSHNVNRRKNPIKKTFGALHGLRLLLLLVGIAGIGYYGYTVSDQYIYEAYQNWAFDQEIAGTHVTFADYVRERTPFGFLAGRSGATVAVSHPQLKPEVNQPPRPVEGSVLGRVQIARLNLAAMVREGVDAKVLSVAVGHVPTTALPGQTGNFAIAAHRDTLFRALKDIHQGDLVGFETPNATYTYKVVATKIVLPTDVSVLNPDGGGLIPQLQAVSSSGQPQKKLLTMITCYPFYYVGSAPKRFIVEAELIGDNGVGHPELNQISDNTPPLSSPGETTLPRRAQHRKSALQAALTNPRTARGLSHSASLRNVSTSHEFATPTQKKRGFWHRLLHRS